MRSNKFLFSFILLMAAPSFACETTKWTIEGKAHVLCFESKSQAFLTSTCVSKSCGASELLKRAESYSLKSLFAQRMSPGNPGEIVCKALEGKPMLGRNESGSQNGFCEAKDGTVVDFNALTRTQTKKQL